MEEKGGVMPRTRTQTDVGYLEVQWSDSGELVCVVSATVMVNADSSRTITQTMHQFTQPGDLGVFIRDLARSRRKSFPDKDEEVVGPMLPSKEDSKDAKNDQLNELIKTYSAESKKIYSEKTAGDYSWEGLLNAFLLDAMRIQEGLSVQTNLQQSHHG